MTEQIVVMKFGGSSLADNEKIRFVAELVCQRQASGHSVVVVVSANGKTTDELLARARALSSRCHKRELDMLLSAGERVSMALLAMAIKDLGRDSISFTGSQCGIITNDNHSNARIIEVRPFRVQDELAKGKVVIVAGFQGVSYKREVTTLGRGGSDTTAVALAAALDATACEIYSDVDGVYTADPRIVDPFRLTELTYDEMLNLSYRGAKVLNPYAVRFAREKGIALYARGTRGGGETVVRRHIATRTETILGITPCGGLFLCQCAFGSLDVLLEGLELATVPTLYLSLTGEEAAVVVRPHMASDLDPLRETGVVFHPCHGISVVGRSLEMSLPWLLKGRRLLQEVGVGELFTEAGPNHLTFYFLRDPNRTELDKSVVRLLHEYFLKGASQGNPDNLHPW